MVVNYQYLPTLCGQITFPLEGLGYSYFKDKNKSLQIIIYSVLDVKDILRLSMMNRNTGNMKNTQLSHRHRLIIIDENRGLMDKNPEMQEPAYYKGAK